ncbi:hypothetical protein [Lentzea cavernae]|uniref:Mce-associated membrane protein n=1 Tax=Lentzea cavernae TaxID=2020703 RepID=A0ABQ3MG69_9PSEU|nr:hypothetical protein [Lentzea cavernae]GHH40507.1 hypothetical protein GCM10017774_34000 [Lentzea cavernae]
MIPSGVAVAVVLAFVAFSLLTDRTERGQATPAPSSSVPAAAPLSDDAAKALAADITSADESRVRRALAISDAQPLDGGAVAQLATITPLVIDVATFDDAKDGTATAKAQAGGPSPTTWTLHFVLHDGNWKISSTEVSQ